MEIKNLAQQYIYWPEVDNIYQKNVDFSQVKVSELDYLFKNQLITARESIEHTIIRFYALNETLAKLRRQENELLDEKALGLYKTYMQEIETSSKKLFSYVFFISLVEARHCENMRDLKNVVSRVVEEDETKVSRNQDKVYSKYSSLFDKNRAKYYAENKAIVERYGNIEYEENDPNYTLFKKEKRKAFARSEKVDNRISRMVSNENRAYEIELKNTLSQRVTEASNKTILEMASNFEQQGNTGEDISREKLIQFLKIFSQMIKQGGYSHSSVYEKLQPLLEQDEFKDLTVSDMMKAMVNVFRFGRFESGYGGNPWGDIAMHGLNFARGEINAEVFMDQAFSLEHNNGNMFNKPIIFKSGGDNYWRRYNVHPSDNDRNEDFVHAINNCQIFLNAQHQGQLLSFLDIDYNKLETNVQTSPLKHNFEEHQKTGLIPKHLTNYNVRSMDSYIDENLNNVKKLLQDFYSENLKFKDILTSFNVEKPEFDMYTFVNGCKEGRTKLKFDDKCHLFFKLNNYQLNKYTEKNVSMKVNSVDYSYAFEYLNTKEVSQDKFSKEILGNKAFGLAQMHEMNLPVPNALVFPTTNASGYFKEKAKWLNDLRPELNKIKNYFTDSQGNPIACSVRSGSSISMPGMMDTILNVGIDDSNYDYFCKKMGKEVTNECVTKFMTLFTKSLFHEDIKFSSNLPKALFQFREVLNRHNVSQNYEGNFPLNARQQYKWCLEAVFKSWHGERAVAYRNHQNVSHDIGTAAIVQQMVFGNLNDQSCTGVVFSRDCISGEKGIIGEFLPKAQGEDVVSGAVTPKNIKELKEFNSDIYNELLGICERLEKDTGDIQDIEFTVEDGKLYILQKRKAVCSSLAQNKLNQELFENGLITEEKLLESINIDSLVVRDIVDNGFAKEEFKGLVGNPGVLRGIVVRSQEDMVAYADLYEQHKRDNNFGWIFYAPETSPDHAPIMLKTQGFITSNGGFTSHAAILSRSWDKPCIVGVGHEDNDLLKSGAIITMDANSGLVYKNILPLKEGSKDEISNLVNRILNHNKINMESLIQEESLNTHSAVLEVNSKKSWMEEYASAVKIENQPPKYSKFLDLGHKVALMVLKSQNDNHKQIKDHVSNIKSSLDTIEKITLEQNQVEKVSKVRMCF